MADSQFRYDDRDVRFVLFEQLGIERLFSLPAFAEQSREDVERLLSAALKMAREVIGPADRAGDREGCRLEDGRVRVPEAYRAVHRHYVENGWVGLTADPELGGAGLPVVVGVAVAEMVSGACCSLAAYGGLTHAAASLLTAYGTEEMKRDYVVPLNAGKWQGTMCLTEPQAGSAVGDTRTVAERDGEQFSIRGNKIFTTCGDHDLTENHIHLVLARTPDAPAGTKGLSIFLVPRVRLDGTPNDVACTRLEEKMGIHGSPTCAMSFGEKGECIGYLIGEERQGIEIMFHMMNEERIATGVQGLALASTAYLNALEYARERIQGVAAKDLKNADAPRVPIVEHPDVRRMLLTQRAYVEGMRALLLTASLHIDLSEHDDDVMAREMSRGVVEILTPICKAWCTDTGFEVTRLAIQTYGGYGYLSDYPVERYMRDVKIASIYEGTNGIQALDLLGRKVGRQGGMLFLQFMEFLGKRIDRHQRSDAVRELYDAVSHRKAQLERVTYAIGRTRQSGDIDAALLSATPYLRMFGNVLVAWLLLDQAAIAHTAGRTEGVGDVRARFLEGKMQTARFFVRQILPENDALAAAIESGDRSPLEIRF